MERIPRFIFFRDVNTLFRSQSLATKIIHEQMKFFGHHYLVISIKPVIDMVSIVTKILFFLFFGLGTWNGVLDKELLLSNVGLHSEARRHSLF